MCNNKSKLIRDLDDCQLIMPQLIFLIIKQSLATLILCFEKLAILVSAEGTKVTS